MKLNEEQIAEAKAELVSTGRPCRFLHNGQAIDITTGELCSRGSNVIYHPVYWNFTETTAKKIAKWLGCNVVFSN